MKSKLLIMCGTLMMSSCTSTKVDLESRVNELYDQMPIEERIAQLRSCYMDELFDDEGNLDTFK